MEGDDLPHSCLSGVTIPYRGHPEVAPVIPGGPGGGVWNAEVGVDPSQALDEVSVSHAHTERIWVPGRGNEHGSERNAHRDTIWISGSISFCFSFSSS